MSAHAKLSASSASRWLACPPSVALCESFPDTTSPFAQEGTLAHEMAELGLRKYTGKLSTRSYNAKIKTLKENELYTPDMPGYVEEYIDFVKESAIALRSPFIAIEQRLDFSRYVRGGFGTGDCIIIGDDTLHIIDLKYGKGVGVSAIENPQLRLYGLGALEAFGFLYDIDCVQMSIVQPRRNDISTDTISAAELAQWGEAIRPLAEKAFVGEGDFQAGEHCRFCRAKNVCRARGEWLISAMEDFSQTPLPLYSNAELGAAIEKSNLFLDFAKGIKEAAQDKLLNGESVPGWKLVEGRRVRAFDDQEQAFSVLMQSGIDEAMLYERKALPLTKIEQVTGKKAFNELLSRHIVLKPGAPTIAPESDKRPAFQLQPTAQDDFQ